MFREKKGFIEYLVLFFIGVLITAFLIMRSETIFSAFSQIFVILTPFYIGFSIAYILNRPVKKVMTTFSLKSGLAIAVTYLSVLVLISVFVRMVLPQVITSSIELAGELSTGVQNLGPELAKYDFGPLQKLVTDNLSRLTEYMGNFTTFLLNNLTKFFLTVTSTVMNLIFGLIISIYMLAEKEKIKALFSQVIRAFLKPKHAEPFLEFAKEANHIFSQFIVGLITEALIVGLLAFIGFSILGVRYAMILAMIITITNVIPYLGPFIGAVPAIVTTLLYDPVKAIWVAIFIVILQQFDGNFIGPKVMGNYIGLSPIWIILFITVGGGYAGVLGIILAIPTGAMLKIVFGKLLQKQVKRREQEKSTAGA